MHVRLSKEPPKVKEKMIDIDVDSYQFGGFAGVRSGLPSQSRFVVQMYSVPRVGESLYVSRSLMPDICLTGPYSPNVESDAHYAGYVALEVVAVSHTVDGQGHRPYLFCKHTRAAFGST